jgi:ATP-binding cassette subfamily B protein
MQNDTHIERKGLLQNARNLWELVRPYRRTFLLGTVVIGGINLLDATPPLATRKFINGLADQQMTWRLVLTCVGIIVGATVVMAVLRYLMSLTFGRLALHATVKLRRRAYTHLQTLEPKFYTETRVGDLMARMTNDLREVRMVLSRGSMFAVDLVISVLVYMPIMFVLSWRLTLCLLAPMALMPLFVKKVGDKVHTSFRKVQDQMGDVGAYAQENITGARVVKAYAQERSAIEEFQRSSRKYLGLNLRHAWWMALFMSVIGLGLGVGMATVIGVGGWEIVAGHMRVGDFVAYFMLMFRIMFPMIALGFIVSAVQRGAASLKRIQELLAVEPEVRDTEATVKEMTRIEGEIEFRRLTFAYNGTRVLEDVSLHVPRGTTLAVVGEVGSGKSTLISMLGRLVEPPDGMVLIDGVDVKRIPLTTLRRHVGYVPQDTFLFSTSIRDNIAFARMDATDKEIERAAEISQLSRDFASFPDGYETLLGERGINLSGGQKQRVAIARAVLARPSILVLDDALSSVDTHTEEEILKRLRGVMRERTSIIVAHRISTLKEADQIVVLERGRIVERGTHLALVAKDGLYASIYRKQLLEEEIEEA